MQSYRKVTEHMIEIIAINRWAAIYILKVTLATDGRTLIFTIFDKFSNISENI